MLACEVPNFTQNRELAKTDMAVAAAAKICDADALTVVPAAREISAVGENFTGAARRVGQHVLLTSKGAVSALGQWLSEWGRKLPVMTANASHAPGTPDWGLERCAPCGGGVWHCPLAPAQTALPLFLCHAGPAAPQRR